MIVLLVALYFVVPTDTHPQRGDVARIVICLILVGVLTVAIAWQVRVQVLEPERHVDGLLIALVVAVLAFAVAFYALARVNPDQISGLHTRLDALYFTVTTLMTVGFGDIYASGQLARAIVLVQMVFNVAVIATAATALGRKVRDRAMERAQERAQQRAERAEQRAEQGGQPGDQPGRRTHRKPT